MNPLEEKLVSCPYCGESFTTLLDISAGDQDYVEDCSICCQPIEFSVKVTADVAQVVVNRQD